MMSVTEENYHKSASNIKEWMFAFLNSQSCRPHGNFFFLVQGSKSVGGFIIYDVCCQGQLLLATSTPTLFTVSPSGC